MTTDKFKLEVKKFEEIENKEEIEKQIRKIMKLFLNNFVLEIKDDEKTVIVEPLRVEAYFHKDNIFEDINSNGRYIIHALNNRGAHDNEFQSGYFANKLHFHKKINCSRGGIDICLSTSNEYYFSLLIKDALIDGKQKTQSEIANALDFIRESNNSRVLDGLLKERDRSNERVLFTHRVNVDGGIEPLAALIENDNYKFKYHTGFGKKKTKENNERNCYL